MLAPTVLTVTPDVAFAAGQASGGQGDGRSASGATGAGGAASARGSDPEARHSGRCLLHDLFAKAEESDRPDWAGRGTTGEKPGSGNQTPGIAKGDRSDEAAVILRDAYGLPICTDEGFVQPIDAADVGTLRSSS